MEINNFFKNTFKPERMKDFTDLRGKDLSEKDLSTSPAETLFRSYFDTETVWPAQEKLPEGFDPEVAMEEAKNPGLGVRELHKEGLTGKGVHVAIIDQLLPPLGHSEYSLTNFQNLVDTDEEGASMHGPAVASILVGKNCGVAPEASLHYFAIPGGHPDFAFCANILKGIISNNEKVSPDEKVKVVSCSFGPNKENKKPGLDSWIEMIKVAAEKGVSVVYGKGIGELEIMGGGSHKDREDFESQELWLRLKNLSEKEEAEILANRVLVPSDYRAFASAWNKDEQYMYSGGGGISWSIPYLCGIFALGLQVKPDLTPEQLIQAVKDTVYTNKKGIKIINPKAFIEKVKDIK